MFIFRNRPVSIMVLSAVLLHLVWAVALFIDPSGVGATAASALHRWIPLPWLPWVIVTCAFMALTALSTRPLWFVLLLVPQQILLMMSASGAVDAIWLGQFADGVVRTRAFLVVDQSYSIVIMLGHTAAIIMYARGRR